MQTKIISTNFDQNIFFSFTCLLGILTIIRDIGILNVPSIYFIIISFITLLFCKTHTIYSFIAFITPLSSGLPTNYIMTLTIIILFIKQKGLFHLHKVAFFCILYILLIEFVSSFRGMFNFLEYISFSTRFLLFGLFLSNFNNEYYDETIFKSFFYGYWFAIVNIFGQMLQKMTIFDILSSGLRIGNTQQLLDLQSKKMLLNFNPNSLGILSNLCIFLSFLFYQRTHQKRYFIMLIGATIIGFMTQSRTFLVVFIFGITLFLILSSNNIKNLFKNFSFLISFISLVSIACFYIFPEYIISTIHRLEVHDLSAGRIDIFSYYFHEILNHLDRLFFGVGLQNYADKYGYYMSAHNSIQEVIITWGLSGLAALLILLGYSFFLRDKRQILSIQYIPFLLVLLSSQAARIFSDSFYPFLLIISYSVMFLPSSRRSYPPVSRQRTNDTGHHMRLNP